MTHLGEPALPAPARSRGIVTFDTADYAAPQAGFRAWQDFMGDRIGEFDYRVGGRNPFYAHVTELPLGPVWVSQVDCSAGSWIRAQRHLADGHDGYNLCMSAGSGYRLIQGEADVVRGPGEFVLIDKSRASECIVDKDGTDYQVIVPRSALNGKRRGNDLTAAMPIDGRSQPLRLLRTYIGSLFAASDDLSDPVVAQKVGEHLLDLVVLGLQPSRENAEQAASRGLKAARLAAILGEINKCYCDPAIGPQTVAAAVNISPRYLHQLLEERGLAFGKVVLELRLNRALNLLTDIRNDHLRIGQIAYDCGFNDLSYFNRCFKTRFGDAPGAVRGGRA
jgi:AraC-like DNA-binding protein